jgi:hypothetical protein
VAVVVAGGGVVVVEGVPLVVVAGGAVLVVVVGGAVATVVLVDEPLAFESAVPVEDVQAAAPATAAPKRSRSASRRDRRGGTSGVMSPVSDSGSP